MTRVVVVEDHVLVRQSLVKSVGAEEDFQVVGEAGAADEALRVVTDQVPDLVLLDIEIPDHDGLELAALIKEAHPQIRVLFLTMHDDAGSIRRAVSLGADGFVPKTASMEELLQGLRTVAAGGTYLSPSVARRVMDMAGGRRSGPAVTLTNRELEILNLLARGMHPQEVATELFVSVKTIKNNLTSIYTKLGVKSAAQAVALAYREGLAERSSSGDGAAAV